MAVVQALWLVIVIACDFSQRRVPNWLVLSGAALAIVALALGRQSLGSSWLDALGAGAIAFAVMLVFYALGLMGAGDVKFAGALGLWTGLQGLLPVFILSSVLAAAHSLLWLALQRWPVWPWLVMALSDPRAAPDTAPPGAEPAMPIASRQRSRHVPYAAYLAIAALLWMAIKPPT